MLVKYATHYSQNYASKLGLGVRVLYSYKGNITIITIFIAANAIYLRK